MTVHLPLASSSRPDASATPVLLSSQLRGAPVRVELGGAAFALWRDASGRACAVLDRCPHRFAPLSAGRVRADGRLACGYHGWNFDADGCGASPSQPSLRGCEVPSVRTVERNGLVWLLDHDARADAVPALDDGMTLIATDADATLCQPEHCLDRIEDLALLARLRTVYGFAASELDRFDFTMRQEDGEVHETTRAAVVSARWRELLGGSDMLTTRVVTRSAPTRVTVTLAARRPLARVEIFVVRESAMRTGLFSLVFAPAETAVSLRAALLAASMLARWTREPRHLAPTQQSLRSPATSPFADEQTRARDARRRLVEKTHATPLAPPPEPPPRPAAPWEGFVPFVVERRVDETHDIASFYLRPKEPRRLPAWLPGQHVTVRVKSPETGKVVMRNYSLSDAYEGAETLRITVKRIAVRAADGSTTLGQCSGVLHAHLREGSELEVRAPKGNFFCDPDDPTPLILLAGGVGLTPLHAMLRACAGRGGDRKVSLLHAVRTPGDAMFLAETEAMKARLPSLRVQRWVSEGEGSIPPEFNVGFITADGVRAVHGSLDGVFMLCGPAAMMLAVSNDLLDAGVEASRIRYEGFGPVSLARLPKPAPPATAPIAGAVQVTFKRTGRTVRWSPGDGPLLAVAQAQKIDVSTGCCVGSCSTCATRIEAGSVRYSIPPGDPPPEGQCLVCIAEPASDVTLDL